jgi:hypothetical protein
MIPALIIGGLLIGTIIGLAIAGWRHATTIAPPLEQSFHCTSVRLQRATEKTVDADSTRQVMAQLSSGRFFEIE